MFLTSQILPSQNAEATHKYVQNYKWSEDSKNHFINSIKESDINKLIDILYFLHIGEYFYKQYIQERHDRAFTNVHEK